MNPALACTTARERLSARLDGEHEADLGAERALLLHLADCAECRAHEQALAELAPAWRALREVTPPADLWARIERRARPPRAARRAPILARVAALLVGFLTLGGGALLLEKQNARTPAAPPAHVLERWLAGLSPRGAAEEPSLAFLSSVPEYQLLRALPRSQDPDGGESR